MSLSNSSHRSMRVFPLSLLASAALAACAVSPDYQRPATSDAHVYGDDSLSNLQGAGGEQTLVAGRNPDAQWWKAFHSEALDATMQQAFAGNRSLAAAQASLMQARETVTASTGSLYPQVNLDAGAGRQKYGAQFGGVNDEPAFDYYSVGPSVRYVFDYTGGQHRAIEQQQALAESQAYQLQAAQLSLSGNVAQQALLIASTRAQIATLEDLLVEDQKNLGLVQSAFDAGSVSRVDVLSAQSQLANDQTLLPPLRQQLSVARHALSVLVGHAPADWTPPDFELADLQLPSALPLSLPSELAHRRPDILAAESQLHAATAGAGVATSKLYPQINLTASVSQQSTSLSHLFDGDSLAWGFAGGLTAPLFDGGSLRAQQRAAQAAQQAAYAQYQQVVLQVLRPGRRRARRAGSRRRSARRAAQCARHQRSQSETDPRKLCRRQRRRAAGARRRAPVATGAPGLCARAGAALSGHVAVVRCLGWFSAVGDGAALARASVIPAKAGIQCG